MIKATPQHTNFALKYFSCIFTAFLCFRHQIIRANTRSKSDLEILHELEKNFSEKVEILKRVKYPDAFVDVLVHPDANDDVIRELQRHGISTEIVFDNLHESVH